MRVLINTIPYYGKGAGLRTYTAALLRALHKLDVDMQWHVVLRQADLDQLGLSTDSRFKPLWAGSTARPPALPGLRFAWRNAIEHLAAPASARGRPGPFDAVHYLDSYGPFLSTAPTPLALTVHDLIPITDRGYHRPLTRAYLAALMRRTIPRAHALLAISQATADTIARVFGTRAGPIHIVPNGIDDHFQPAPESERARVRARYGLDDPFVLFVGTVEPRKNLPRLIRSFAAARREYNLPHRLVIAGKVRAGAGELRQALADVALGDACLPLGFVPDQDLPALLSSADMLSYVSLQEGFGLPVAEAMGCGAPVMTSSVAALIEVAGDAAELVDPTDEREIAAAIGRLCRDARLRSTLSTRGLVRAGRFRWSAVACETARIYRGLAGGEPARR